VPGPRARLGKESKLCLPREFLNLLGNFPPLAGYVVVRVFRYGVPRLSRQPLALLRLGQAPFDSRRVHGRQFSRVKLEKTPRDQARSSDLCRPHHQEFGFLAAVAPIEAFIDVDIVVRWPRKDETHAIAAARRAEPYHGGRTWIGLVGMWHGALHGPQTSIGRTEPPGPCQPP
jgi:hypothetical protein